MRVRRPSGTHVLPGATLALLLATLSAGCSETVDPTLGTAEPFTLYGFFDARADTQAVRVIAIADRLNTTGAEPIDARVTSTDRERGATYVWSDSLVRFGDGSAGHVFYAPYQAAYEHTHHLEARRSDGNTAEVTVTMPPLVEPVAQPSVPFVEFGRREIFLPVHWPGAPRLNQIEVFYTVQAYADTTLVGDSLTVRRTYNQAQVPEGDGWTVPVALIEDARFVLGVLERPRPSQVVLHAIEMRALVSNAEWFSPVGAYDAELLVEPGTLSNVENGFGFVGAGYVSSLVWLPEPEDQRRAGFLVLE